MKAWNDKNVLNESQCLGWCRITSCSFIFCVVRVCARFRNPYILSERTDETETIVIDHLLRFWRNVYRWLYERKNIFFFFADIRWNCTCRPTATSKRSPKFVIFPKFNQTSAFFLRWNLSRFLSLCLNPEFWFPRAPNITMFHHNDYYRNPTPVQRSTAVVN